MITSIKDIRDEMTTLLHSDYQENINDNKLLNYIAVKKTVLLQILWSLKVLFIIFLYDSLKLRWYMSF